MNYLKNAFSLFMTCMSTLFGDIDKSFYFLLIIICLDYFTGIIDAYKHNEISSKKGLEGFLKKCGYIVIIILANLVDVLMNLNGTLRTLVIYFFIANDGISILENLGGIGVPLPKKLYIVLKELKEEDAKEIKETKIIKEEIEAEEPKEIIIDTSVPIIEPLPDSIKTEIIQEDLESEE